MTIHNRTTTDERERASIAAALEAAERALRARQTSTFAGAPGDGEGWTRPPVVDDALSRPNPLDAAEDRPAYHQWLRHRGESVSVGPPRRAERTRRPRLRAPFLTAVLYALDGTDELISRSVGSVLGQTLGSWELVVSDDGADAGRAAVIASLASTDPRVRVVRPPSSAGREAAFNAAMSEARGNFVAVVGARDELERGAFAGISAAVAATPDADVVYTDEDRIDADGERFAPRLKPVWSPDLLLGTNYLGQLTAVRRTLLADVGALRAGFGDSAAYDLLLRATEQARAVVHVPEISYHRRGDPNAKARDPAGASAARAIADALRRRGEPSAIIEEGPITGARNVRHPITGAPLVSIIVPFRDEPALLAACASSIRANAGYDRFELILVNNGSELPETFALVERLLEGPNVRLVEDPGPFNWSAINNSAVRACEGELLLFLNNDIESRRARWLDALVGHAIRPEVGAVGARLVYPDGTIQHAGVVVSLGGLAAHVLRGLPGDRPGYLGMATQTRNCTAVTGACMMTRRDLFESLGGFDETLPASFNDVDYCMRLRAGC